MKLLKIQLGLNSIKHLEEKSQYNCNYYELQEKAYDFKKGAEFGYNKAKENIKELGDVCWFVAEVCTNQGISLEEVTEKNLEKLKSRKERGVIHGSGDNR